MKKSISVSLFVLSLGWAVHAQAGQGLYVAGNCLGGRYGFGYSTPFAGNSVGMAMTHGWTAGHQVASDKKFLGEPVEAMEAPAGGPGGPH